MNNPNSGTYRMTFLRVAIWLIQVAALFMLVFVLAIQDASAQDSAPPSGAWSEVILSDGTINYGDLTDNGVVQQHVNWIPTVAGVPIATAEYHSYTTPTGNQILMPTATTLFFMAMNPSESGYLAASSTLGTNGPTVSVDAPIGIASPAGLFASLLGNTGGDQMAALSSLAGQGGPASPESFFAALASGQTNIWSMSPDGTTNFLQSLFGLTANDFLAGNGINLYTYMLLYPPGSCGQSPIGCTPEQLALLASLDPASVPTPPPPPDTPNCPSPRVIPGAITFSAEKVAPNYPLVVGQDPNRRGADVRFHASVAPTIYITYEAQPEYRCAPRAGSPGGNGCPVNTRREIDEWVCIEVQQSFNECIASARGSASLSDASRDWILHELSNRYPGAYLHNPDFGFGTSGGACQWSDTATNVQFADPGYWDLSVRGRTSGTPVSGPRNFGGGAGTLEVWLKEIAIIK